MLDGRVSEASQVEYTPFGNLPLKRETDGLSATVEGGAHRFSYASARTRHHPGTIAARGGWIWLPRACDPQTRALVRLPAKAKAGIWLCKTQVGYLFVEGLEIRARCLARLGRYEKRFGCG